MIDDFGCVVVFDVCCVGVLCCDVVVWIEYEYCIVGD